MKYTRVKAVTCALTASVIIFGSAAHTNASGVSYDLPAAGVGLVLDEGSSLSSVQEEAVQEERTAETVQEAEEAPAVTSEDIESGMTGVGESAIDTEVVSHVQEQQVEAAIANGVGVASVLNAAAPETAPAASETEVALTAGVESSVNVLPSAAAGIVEPVSLSALQNEADNTSSEQPKEQTSVGSDPEPVSEQSSETTSEQDTTEKQTESSQETSSESESESSTEETSSESEAEPQKKLLPRANQSLPRRKPLPRAKRSLPQKKPLLRADQNLPQKKPLLRASQSLPQSRPLRKARIRPGRNLHPSSLPRARPRRPVRVRQPRAQKAQQWKAAQSSPLPRVQRQLRRSPFRRPARRLPIRPHPLPEVLLRNSRFSSLEIPMNTAGRALRTVRTAPVS